MDPRRTRDPRLARASDPRLQRPASNPPVSSSTQLYGNGASRPGSNSHTPNNYTPPQPFVQAGDTVVQSLPFNVDAAGSSQLSVAEQDSNVQKYKQRPLFCVVCASNQVSTCRLSVILLVINTSQNRSMEGHYILA
jgi:RNA polymerase II subunit A C-terminal domain phosphatase SSU72